MQTIACCIVGYGGIAAFHAEALRKIDGVRLHTVVGRRAEPSEEFKRKMGFERATTRYEDALEDPGIDAVVVAAPSELHHDMTAQALNAGKDVLVEIPLAMSHKGGRDLVGLARKTGRKVMVAHSRRFEPSGRFLRDFIASGKAGQVYQHQSYGFTFRHENIGWTGYHRSWVDDVLFHHTCHHVDFSLWTLDSAVRRVRGELSPLHPEIGTSLDVSLLIRYANEAIATISLSYNARKGAGGNLFICEKGTLVHARRQVLFNGDVVFEPEEDEEAGILAQDREFIRAIREDRQPACTAEDALKSLAVLQQVYDQMVTLEGEEKYRRRWDL